MRRGFTILELLVASMLLGMLVTILTMVFNQSSIAWRTGTAGVADLDDIRDNMAEIREEADNAFAWGNYVYRSVGLWDRNGELRDRSCDAENSQVANEDGGKWRAHVLRNNATGALTQKSNRKLFSSQNMLSVGQSQNPRNFKTYTVNVMSGGPNRQLDDWDDVWSWPDDFE